jgi:hypothetical protein
MVTLLPHYMNIFHPFLVSPPSFPAPSMSACRGGPVWHGTMFEYGEG